MKKTWQQWVALSLFLIGYVGCFAGEDWPGDVSHTYTSIRKIFCQRCPRGRELEVKDAFERGRSGMTNDLHLYGQPDKEFFK